MAKPEITDFFARYSSYFIFLGSVFVGIIAFTVRLIITSVNKNLIEAKNFLEKNIKDLKDTFERYVLDQRSKDMYFRGDIQELHKRVDENFAKIAMTRYDLNGVGEKLQGHINKCDYIHKRGK